MQSAAANTAGRLAYSPDLGAESSFPERHLDDDKAPFSGIEPGRHHGVVPLPSQAWPGQSRPYLHHNHVRRHRTATPNKYPLAAKRQFKIHARSPLAGPSNTISAPYPQPAVTSPHAEWPSFHEQPPGTLFWQHAAPPEFSLEDDSDSIQSHNDSPEEFCPPLPTLTSARKPGRQGSHHRAPANPTTAVPTSLSTPTHYPAVPTSLSTPTHYPAAPTLLGRSASDRPYLPDFDYHADGGGQWLDPSDPNTNAAAGGYLPSHPAARHGNHHAAGAAAAAGDIEITYRDSSSSSKVNSKRIAHKLSEKTRRNRLTIAIREIQKLLPSEESGGGGGGGGGAEGEDRDGRGGEADFVVRPGVPSSKLDVVEMAVGFIRDLKERNREMARRLWEAERRVEECRCRSRGEGAEEMEDAAG